MAQEFNIFKALRQQNLWPTLHAAVDVYQRRRAASADHYELIWRLIHMTECMIITLAAAAISRLRVSNSKDDYLKLRERCYGVAWNSTEDSIDRRVGALDGSIEQWVEILRYVSSLKDTDGSHFISALKRFLIGQEEQAGDGLVDLTRFVRAWSLACDVPTSILAKAVSALDAFRAVNTFRNRFAHVPFPYDQIQCIYQELEECTFKLYEIEPSPTNARSCLCGSFAIGESVLKGPGHGKMPDSWVKVEHESFVWGDRESQEIWEARPFIFLDKMMRPYLLSRLKDEAGLWEYTRYLAESNAIYNLTGPELFKLLPRPAGSEYARERAVAEESAEVETEAVTPSHVEVNTRSDAIEAMKRRQFEPAISYWEVDLDKHRDYHTGWLRLGFCQRELGVDLSETDTQRAMDLFTEAPPDYRIVIRPETSYE